MERVVEYATGSRGLTSLKKGIMLIQEKCKSWTMDYNVEGLPELNENETEAVKVILHSSGDIVAILGHLPELEPGVKETIVGSLAFIMMEAKQQAIAAVDNVLGTQALNAPLEDDFSAEEIFGLDLTESFKETLNEEEINIASEHFSPIKEDEDNGEDEVQENGDDGSVI